MTETAKAEAAAALEVAIQKVMDLVAEPGSVATDAVLLIGVQYIDSDNDRCGYVNVIPRNHSQPSSYITRGLLAEAKRRIERAEDEG